MTYSITQSRNLCSKHHDEIQAYNEYIERNDPLWLLESRSIAIAETVQMSDQAGCG